MEVTQQRAAEILGAPSGEVTREHIEAFIRLQTEKEHATEESAVIAQLLQTLWNDNIGMSQEAANARAGVAAVVLAVTRARRALAVAERQFALCTTVPAQGMKDFVTGLQHLDAILSKIQVRQT